MASLVSAPSLDIEGVGKLPAGKLLIMGGDQVYPFPSRKAYRDRFEFPYKAALPASSDGSWRRLLFVLPGNHDWYDGLSSFDYMFCKARFGRAAENRIGGWMCPQHRSYFAIRLPHNWWIWGADIQLAQYLDAGQVLYFEGVAEAMKQHPTEAPKLILCTPEPSWNYDKDDKLQGDDNLSHITKIANDAGARICAVIAGDLHHYARCVTEGTATNFVTAGGGGAYFSPTHYLNSHRHTRWLGSEVGINLRCQLKDGKPTGKASCWPSRTTSRRMSLSTLLFPFRNYGFAVALGAIYWLMIWVYATTTLPGTHWHYTTVGEILIKDEDFRIFPHLFLVTPLAAANNVLLGIMCLVLWVVLYVVRRYGLRNQSPGGARDVPLGGAHRHDAHPLFPRVVVVDRFHELGVAAGQADIAILRPRRLASGAGTRAHDCAVPARDDLHRRHRRRLRLGRLPDDLLPHRTALRSGLRLDGHP